MTSPFVVIVFAVLIAIPISSPATVCAQSSQAVGETLEPVRFAPGEKTGRFGAYLGEKPPGLTPVIFAPGIVSSSGHYEMDLFFSRDGKECYLGRDGQMLASQLSESGWTAPEPAPARFDHFSPMALTSLQGDLLVLSGRGELAVSQLTDGEWGPPEFVMRGMGKSIADSGAIYTSWLDGESGEWRLFRARRTENGYASPELIGLDYAATHPQVAPDGSFVVFESEMPGGFGGTDFYIVFREDDGAWSDPVNLGIEVNSPDQNARARLSPDGDFLFFNRFGDIYWVSTEYLYPLRGW
jgi:hypothetical protein